MPRQWVIDNIIHGTEEATRMRPTVTDTFTVAGLRPLDLDKIGEAVDVICEEGKTAVVVIYEWELGDDDGSDGG